MKIFTQRLEQTETKTAVETVALTFDTRQKSRFRATLENGEDVGVDLPRTGILRSGALIATEHGDVLRVDAKAERLMQVTAQSDFDLLKAAYHLGNRHVPLMLTPSALYFEPDHVLAEMMVGLGLTVTETEHPFEPESGAYAQHSHSYERLSKAESKPLSSITAIHAHDHH
ncbi:urease accessory protein UreE [Acinetobacter sp. Marseille-Q1618]|uniref:urease accessory protein UreE n=1 Tax=Acinetobacter sp. Marseille-Q1618 TaxID=2697502 RepID=UPI00156DB809|nr:urease accessory protein UreE [Acinetobacter sp. Marseille-Q1618]